MTDARFSMLSNKIQPMWGLVIDDKKDFTDHANWSTCRSLDQSQLDSLIELLSGVKCRNNSRN